MNTVIVNAKQLLGATLGLLVVAAAIIVNIRMFGSDLSLINLVSYLVLGVLVIFTMMVLVKD